MSARHDRVTSMRLLYCDMSGVAPYQYDRANTEWFWRDFVIRIHAWTLQFIFH